MGAWANMSSSEYQMVLSYFCMPLFTCLIIISSVGAIAFAVFAVINADACSGGENPGTPDGTILAVLNKFPIEPDSFLHKTVTYYTQGCQAESPFQAIYAEQRKLDEAVSSVHQFLESLYLLGDACDTNSLQNALITLSKSITNMLLGSSRALALLSCPRINMIYAKTVHESLCTYSIGALFWIFVSLVVISFSGMAVIMLRASWLDVESFLSPLEDRSEHDDESESKRFLDYLPQ